MPAQRGRGKQGQLRRTTYEPLRELRVKLLGHNRGNVSFDTQERGCFVLEVVHILRSLVLIKG